VRTETRTVRIGERTGDIDWSYNFRKHYDTLCTNNAGRDEACERRKKQLHQIEEAFKNGVNVRATTYGGWPRCGMNKVIDVGMYDGWPYWYPVPSVCTAGTFGAEWHSFDSFTDIEIGENK
jgi:hypothetical protein